MINVSSRLRQFFDRISRRIRLGDHFLAIFIPHDLRGDLDAVQALAPNIMGRIKPPPRLLMLSEAVNGVQEASEKAGLPSVPLRMALFAHPNASENEFAINPSKTVKLASLPPRWWQTASHQYEFIYAHVCNGASILSREPWTAVFPRWVSYQMVVQVFLGTPRAQERWTELGTNLLIGTWQSENVDGLFLRVQATYYEVMARLWDTFDARGGDDITLAFLEKALAALAKRPA